MRSQPNVTATPETLTCLQDGSFIEVSRETMLNTLRQQAPSLTSKPRDEWFDWNNHNAIETEPERWAAARLQEQLTKVTDINTKFKGETVHLAVDGYIAQEPVELSEEDLELEAMRTHSHEHRAIYQPEVEVLTPGMYAYVFDVRHPLKQVTTSQEDRELQKNAKTMVWGLQSRIAKVDEELAYLEWVGDRHEEVYNLKQEQLELERQLTYYNWVDKNPIASKKAYSNFEDRLKKSVKFERFVAHLLTEAGLVAFLDPSILRKYNYEDVNQDQCDLACAGVLLEVKSWDNFYTIEEDGEEYIRVCNAYSIEPTKGKLNPDGTKEPDIPKRQRGYYIAVEKTATPSLVVIPWHRVEYINRPWVDQTRGYSEDTIYVKLSDCITFDEMVTELREERRVIIEDCEPLSDDEMLCLYHPEAAYNQELLEMFRAKLQRERERERLP